MDDATRRLWVERTIGATCRAFSLNKHSDWRLQGRLLPHFLSVASWFQRHYTELHKFASNLYKISYKLCEPSTYFILEPFLLEAMESRRTALGDCHPNYATSLIDLAWL